MQRYGYLHDLPKGQLQVQVEVENSSPFSSEPQLGLKLKFPPRYVFTVLGFSSQCSFPLIPFIFLPTPYSTYYFK